jgi:hypothetical protein
MEIAIDAFAALIRTYATEEIAKDARRDLAFIMARFTSEDEILGRSEHLFPKPSDRLEFLRIVEGNREQQGKSSVDSKILQRIIDLEVDPIRKVQVYLGLLSVVHKEYASATHINVFGRIQAILDNAKVQPLSKQISPVEKLLDEETQKLARAYIDTFSGKAINPEKISKPTLSQDLKSIFAFYTYYFPKSQYSSTIYRIWMDVCADSEDWSCVVSLNQKVQSGAGLEALREKSSLTQIVALEALMKKDRKTYHPQLEQALDGFIKSYPKSTSWLRTAKRRVDLRFDDKQYEQALPVLDQILVLEPNEENMYRAQWARFQVHKFEEVTAHLQDSKYATLSNSQRLQALKREALLETAKSARERGDASVYKNSIQQFISNSSDATKTKIARQDLLRFDLEKGLYPEAAAELLKISPTDRVAPEFKDSFETLVTYHLKRGEFQKSNELFKGVPEKTLDPSLLFAFTLSKLGAGDSIKRADLERLPATQQSYIITLLCLTQPKVLVSWFKQNPPRKDEDRRIALLSTRLDRGSWNFAPTREEGIWFKGLLNEPVKDAPLTSVERKIQALSYPTAKTKGTKYDQAVQSLVVSTRTIREQVPKDIQGKTSEVQRRVFKAARMNEEKLAQLILSSPTPAGLSAEQEAQYHAGLQDLSKEFSDQAIEFGKLETAAENAIKQAELEENARMLPALKADKWSWPSAPEPWIENLVKAHNSIGALVVLDLRRKEWFSKDDVYYFYRTGVLLNASDGEVMRRYLYEELTAAKQDGVISKCKEIAQ